MVANHVRANLLEQRGAILQWTASGVLGTLENVRGHAMEEPAKFPALKKQGQRMEGNHAQDHLSIANPVTISVAPWTVNGIHGLLPAVQSLAKNLVVLQAQEQKLVQQGGKRNVVETSVPIPKQKLSFATTMNAQIFVTITHVKMEVHVLYKEAPLNVIVYQAMPEKNAKKIHET